MDCIRYGAARIYPVFKQTSSLLANQNSNRNQYKWPIKRHLLKAREKIISAKRVLSTENFQPDPLRTPENVLYSSSDWQLLEVTLVLPVTLIRSSDKCSRVRFRDIKSKNITDYNMTEYVTHYSPTKTRDKETVCVVEKLNS